MRTADLWKDYELIDCSDGERLERWKNIILVRPDPQVIWKTPKENPLWYDPHAVYNRSNTGGGSWQVRKKMPDVWQVGFENLNFNIKTMGFKHTGLFPEQAVNWKMTADIIRNAGRPVKVLNLFAYTGGATVAALEAGASVTHVDASKGMTLWAKENAAASYLTESPVRWLVDDCIKFVQREIRRGNKYDIIIMDPPSYGRGPGGEVWKLENEVYGFVEMCSELLTEDSLMVLINSYTTGLSPSVMEYILGETIEKKFGGSTQSDEIGLPVSSKPGRVLPCGASAIWLGKSLKQQVNI
ncbi:MAG: class I SAM-dependent methyltransferase [Clostridia bacterium]|nr:class I SAM-dependent methyltransferase [Clostridia bacterium]